MSQAKFPEVGNVGDFNGRERTVLDLWKKERTFQRSIENNKNNPTYVFYDGPPFATGLPHYGHLLAGTIKDVVPRYWTMRGRYIERRFGWDCHGLPVEVEVQKKLNIKDSREIELELGVARFNEECRMLVKGNVDAWRTFVERSGRWVDMENDYRTMDVDFMESIWWVFRQLWDKGLVYQGKKVTHFSWKLSSPLSNFEATQNYKDVQDPALTVVFPIIGKPEHALTAWTTTPWTLPSNLALTVHPDLVYGLFPLKQAMGSVTHVWILQSQAGVYAKQVEVQPLETKRGKDLVGLKYEPLFPFFKNHPKAFQVISGEFVTEGSGTGIVHTAPAFGEDDYRVSQAAGIEMIDPVSPQGNFTDLVKPYEGQNIKDAEKNIIKDLKAAHRILLHETLNHAYPFCYRTDTPLIYKAISSWFVRVEDLKEKMVAHNKKIRWVPNHLQEGRFGKWLENARDWSISRNRYWGNPIPLWLCESCGDVECLGSRKELEQKSGQKVEDLHKHLIDSLTWSCEKCKKGTKKRTPEVLDCWFESGGMPYAQNHYPFENKEKFEASFPAEFIAEGQDQTRGWFYTLHVLSAALFDKPAFKNVIVNGIVLAEDGKKMSKSLKNYPDPMLVMDKYGADAMRLYMISSGAMQAEDLRFSETNLAELLRDTLIPLWNAYGFFSSYGNIDKFSRGKHWETPPKSEALLDRWILSRLGTLTTNINRAMEAYELFRVSQSLIPFIDDLTNWYIRRSRRRFWESDSTPDKKSAYETLGYVLVQLSRLLAPFTPFTAETLYRNIVGDESVHLQSFPTKTYSADENLEQDMAVVRTVVELGRNLRAKHNLPVRQPLAKISVMGIGPDQLKRLGSLIPVILEELNMKAIDTNVSEESLVDLIVKPNLKVLGKRLGQKLNAVKERLGKLTFSEAKIVEQGGSLQIEGESIGSEDLLIDRKAKGTYLVASAGAIAVAIDSTVTKELKEEGFVREIMRVIQNKRKEAQLHLSDRIETVLIYQGVAEGFDVKSAFTQWENFLKEETLTDKFTPSEGKGSGEVDLSIHGVDIWLDCRRK